MTAKDRALEYIKAHPGLDALQIKEGLGIKQGWRMGIRDLEKEGKIRWNEELGGWEAEKVEDEG